MATSKKKLTASKKAMPKSKPVAAPIKHPHKRGHGLPEPLDVAEVSATRNANHQAGARGGAFLEDSVGKSSRKSTRISSDHTKRTTNQQLAASRKTAAPSSRAHQRGAGGKGQPQKR